MLGLGNQIGGAKVGLGGFIGDNDSFGGAKDAVNVHLALHQLFGIGHEYVARPANLVHFGNGFRAIGHSGDGRRAADLIDGIHAGNLGGGQYRRVQGFVAAPGSGQDDFLDPGDPGGNSRHQHGGGIGGGAAGGVQADPFQGEGHFPQALGQVNPMAGPGSPVKVGNAPGRQLQGGFQFRGYGSPGLGQFVIRYPKIG